MELTQEALKEKFEYREDGHLYYLKSAGRAKKGSRAGTITSKRYIRIKTDRKHYYEHSLVFLYHYGRFPKEIDHINHCKSDNRITNLREVTKTQNLANSKPKKGGLSVFKGVSFNEHCPKHPWKARIGVNGHQTYIGSFADEVEAARAYDKAAVERRGEYAYTNEAAGLY